MSTPSKIVASPEAGPPPTERASWSKLRIPVFIGSLGFLGIAIAGNVIVPEMQLEHRLPMPLTALFHRQHDEPPRKEPELAYAARLRADAERLAEAGNYEGALARLDQASPHDREGDLRSGVQRLRSEVLTQLGEVPDPSPNRDPDFDPNFDPNPNPPGARAR